LRDANLHANRPENLGNPGAQLADVSVYGHRVHALSVNHPSSRSCAAFVPRAASTRTWAGFPEGEERS
jgi:hypothetical protein